MSNVGVVRGACRRQVAAVEERNNGLGKGPSCAAGGRVQSRGGEAVAGRSELFWAAACVDYNTAKVREENESINLIDGHVN